MKKVLIISSILLTVLALTSLTQTAYASVRCERQYGGGEICVKTGNIQVDKEVLNPADGKFADNLSIASEKFTPSQEITFKIKVKNVGDAEFAKVEVTDSLPSTLELLSGETSYEIKNLKVGEVSEKTLKAKVVSEDKLPKDKSVICDLNAAEAKADSEKDRDTSQFCIEKRVLGVTTLPQAGPEGVTLGLLVSGTLALTGASLLRVKKLWA